MPHVVGRHYDTQALIRVNWTGERIDSVETLDARPPDTTGAAVPCIAPGLFDLQINGYGGVWFSDPKLTVEKVEAAVKPYLSMGVTRLCPTLITASHEALKAGMAAIRAACERIPWVRSMVVGCHLEGPFISPVDGCRGAHPREHVRPADWNEFQVLQESSGGRLKLVTLAPEAPYALDFIRKATAEGVVVSLGHTCAETHQIEAAVGAGASLSTHLGNGAQGMIRRHPNYIWDQLAEPRLKASLIVDGQHLPANVVRVFVRAKGADSVILTCDASGWAGCAPGVYDNHLGTVEVLDDSRVVVAGQRQFLAGSGVGTDTCVLKAHEFTGLPLARTIDMAGRIPAELLRLDARGLAAGGRADLMLFDTPRPGDQKLRVRGTVLAGELVHGTLDV
jgi:N-acetylglucosamine-6-phosphate deacetylase